MKPMTRSTRSRPRFAFLLLISLCAPLALFCSSEVDVEKLYVQANSDDYEERTEAREKLAELVEKGRVDTFARGLNSENGEARVQSMLHLLAIKDPRANDPLVGELELSRRFQAYYHPIRLQPSSTPSDSRILAAHILLIRGGDPRAVEVLARTYGKEPDGETRVGTIYALGALADPRTVPALKRGLKDSNLKVVQAAIEGLAQLQVPDVAATLIQGLSDPSEAVRINSATALSGFPGKPAADALMGTLKKDPSVLVRRAALRSLAGAAGTGAFDPALAVLRASDKDEAMREEAIQVLQSLTGQNFGQDAEKWVSWWNAHRAEFEKR